MTTADWFDYGAQAMANFAAFLAFSKDTSGIEDMMHIPDYFIIGLPIATVLVGAGMIMGCVNFMWDIRHPKTE